MGSFILEITEHELQKLRRLLVDLGFTELPKKSDTDILRHCLDYWFGTPNQIQIKAKEVS